MEDVGGKGGVQRTQHPHYRLLHLVGAVVSVRDRPVSRVRDSVRCVSAPVKVRHGDERGLVGGEVGGDREDPLRHATQQPGSLRVVCQLAATAIGRVDEPKVLVASAERPVRVSTPSGITLWASYRSVAKGSS